MIIDWALGEVLAIVFVFTSVMTCMLSKYTADWIEAERFEKAFGEMIGIQNSVLPSSVVLYF